MTQRNTRQFRIPASTRSKRLGPDGFSLIENLVAIMVLALAVAAVAATMVYARSMFVGASTRNELQQLVETDLAFIRQANERLSCKSGTCELVATDTTRSSYFPDIGSDGAVNSATTAVITKLNNLCRGLGIDNTYTSASSDGGFAWQLASSLPAANSRISRTMIRESRGQRYNLVYTEAKTGRFLRVVTLVPTTVSWCPNDLP
jgi:prepilin-type N-terminal cleavage/methylation domain-containing protein